MQTSMYFQDVTEMRYYDKNRYYLMTSLTGGKEIRLCTDEKRANLSKK